jgi:hypothetical protein
MLFKRSETDFLQATETQALSNKHTITVLPYLFHFTWTTKSNGSVPYTETKTFLFLFTKSELGK